MNRRDLIQRVVLGGTALIIIPSALAGCVKDMTPDPVTNNDPGGGMGAGNITADLSLPSYSSLNTSGASVIIQGIIVVNTGSGNYVALSSMCTHQGCTVSYNSGADNIICPCHGSVFSTTGTVLTGPATIALRTYPVSKTGNILTITR